MNFISNAMGNWEEELAATEQILGEGKIQRGIFHRNLL